MKLRGASLRLLHSPPLADIAASLNKLAEAGANAVSIIPHHYVYLAPGTAKLATPPKEFGIPWFIYPDVGQDAGHPFENTPDAARVFWSAKYAESLGMTVLLKPHIDSYYGGWRGFISVAGLKSDWVYSYKRRFLAAYIEMAQQLSNPILSLGCELYTVTKELGIDFWYDVAHYIRHQGYHGPLTYAANWGWAADAEYNRLAGLWAELDYVGVDAYFPLLPAGYPGDASVDELVSDWSRKGIDADWCPAIDADLLAVAKAAGKPLLFTEIGYANRSGAAIEPGRDSLPTDVRDDQAQLNAAVAARKRWETESNFAGWFWWEWLLGAKPAICHNIEGMPAQEAVLAGDK